MSTDVIKLLSALLLCATQALAQVPAPAPPQSKSILITGGTVHVGDGKVIDDGAVGFREGRIDYVGFEYGVKTAYDTVIHVKGEHVYPGFIVPDSPLGLIEIDAMWASSSRNSGPSAPTRVIRA